MKKIITIAFVAFAACALKADYLYWQVHDGSNSNVSGYNYVNLWASSTSNNPLVGYTKVTGQEYTGGEVIEFNIGNDYSSYENYFVEYVTYNSADNTVNRQGGYGGSWENLKGAISAAQLDLTSGVVAYTGGTYKNVPEPTSGLMLMLGLALMGLKRKRA